MNRYNKNTGSSNTNLVVIRSIYVQIKWETGSTVPSSRRVLDKNHCLPAQRPSLDAS